MSMGFRVTLRGGPAEGFSYESSIFPEARLAVAPLGRDGSWTHVLRTGEPWPGQVAYARSGVREVHDDGVIEYVYRHDPGAVI
jgi:hypothetical protein